MAFTKIVPAGINTGGSYTLQDLDVVGVLTAASFSGPLTGDATGLTGTPDITVGAITAASADFTGNVSIGGTLTYEDVTNVDSVGLITARSGIHVTGGSVGIGTDNPTFSLQVQDDTESLARFRRENTGSSHGGIIVGNQSRAIKITGGGDGLIITDNTLSQERLRITSSGNIGIGTDNPGTIESWSPAGTYLHVGGSTASGVMMKSNYPRLVWNEMDQGANSAIFQINMSEGQMQFQHINDDGSIKAERLRINSDGNIGINQGSPSEKLEIYAGDILLSSNAAGVSGGVGPNAALKFEYNGHQYAKIVGNGRDSSGYGDIDFYTSTSAGVTNLTQRMTIRADGNVGIGTDNPSFSNGSGLEIARTGTACIRIEGNNENHALEAYADSNGATLDARGSSANLMFDIGGSEKVRINSSGNVGIGSQSPGVKLDVQAPGSSSRQNLARFRHEGQTDLVIQGQWGSQDIGGANGTLLYNSIQTLALRSGSSGDAHLVLRNSGNIGVGTAEPDAKLHLYQSDATNYSTTSDQRSEAELRITNPLETAGTFSSVNFYNGGGTGGDISLNAVKSSNYVSYFSIKQRAGGGSTDWRERLRIHPSGQVTMPEQPAWNLRPNSSSTESVSPGSNFVGWSANTTGSSPSICFLKGGVTLAGSTGSTILGGASTGRITVPVAGRYKIWCTIRCENTPGAGNIYLWINNGLVARQHVEVWGRYNYAHGFHSHIVDLNANDYIQWQVLIGGGSYNISGYNDTVNWTGGHLIG